LCGAADPIQLELNKARFSQRDAIFHGAEFQSQLAMPGRFMAASGH